jgi:hypothetical protein
MLIYIMNNDMNITISSGTTMINSRLYKKYLVAIQDLNKIEGLEIKLNNISKIWRN